MVIASDSGYISQMLAVHVTRSTFVDCGSQAVADISVKFCRENVKVP